MAIDGEHPRQEARDQSAGEDFWLGVQLNHMAKGTPLLDQVKEDKRDFRRKVKAVTEPAQE